MQLNASPTQLCLKRTPVWPILPSKTPDMLSFLWYQKTLLRQMSCQREASKVWNPYKNKTRMTYLQQQRRPWHPRRLVIIMTTFSEVLKTLENVTHRKFDESTLPCFQNSDILSPSLPKPSEVEAQEQTAAGKPCRTEVSVDGCTTPYVQPLHSDSSPTPTDSGSSRTNYDHARRDSVAADATSFGSQFSSRWFRPSFNDEIEKLLMKELNGEISANSSAL